MLITKGPLATTAKLTAKLLFEERRRIFFAVLASGDKPEPVDLVARATWLRHYQVMIVEARFQAEDHLETHPDWPEPLRLVEDTKGRLFPSAAAHLRSALESIDRWESVARAAVFWSTRRRKHLDYDVAQLAPLPE